MQNGKLISFLHRFEYRDVAILAEEAVFYAFGVFMIAIASAGVHRWLFLGAFLLGVPAGMAVTYVYNRIVSSRFHRDMPGYAWFGYPMGLGFLMLALQACGESLLPVAIMAMVCGFVLLMGLLTISNEVSSYGVTTCDESFESFGFSKDDVFAVNPATGLAMVGLLDAGGNICGTDSSRFNE